MKLKPYGLTHEDKEEPYVRIISDRVQKLIDLYRRIMLNILGQQNIKTSRYSLVMHIFHGSLDNISGYKP